MSDIPVTHKEFERWYEQHQAEWPPELQELGYRANNTLFQIDNNPPWQQQALEEHAPKFVRAQAGHLMAFAEAYGRWKEFRKR